MACHVVTDQFRRPLSASDASAHELPEGLQRVLAVTLFQEGRDSHTIRGGLALGIADIVQTPEVLRRVRVEELRIWLGILRRWPADAWHMNCRCDKINGSRDLRWQLVALGRTEQRLPEAMCQAHVAGIEHLLRHLNSHSGHKEVTVGRRRRGLRAETAQEALDRCGVLRPRRRKRVHSLVAPVLAVLGRAGSGDSPKCLLQLVEVLLPQSEGQLQLLRQLGRA
mmetsp:Transcript_131026/g.184701  ORF Transcript_131026/g.184701 Transcript_131026/m.184701 type:complete len:224 (+) Transcript_131026:1035-1706(+)